MPRGNSRRRKVSNTLRKYVEKMWLQKMTGSTCYYKVHDRGGNPLESAVRGRKQSGRGAYREREAGGAGGGGAERAPSSREKHESLELDSKTQASELAAALESAKSAKAQARKALQEIEAMKKIAAGKAFIMQSKHVKVNYLLLT